MVYGVFPSQKFIRVPYVPYNRTSLKQSPLSSNYFCSNNRIKHQKDAFIASVASPLPHQPINTEYLQREFSGHGVTFKDIGVTSIAKLEMANGSTATLVLPSGVISSYKVPVWHGGMVELLHTAVSKGEDGDAVIQGGISLDLKFEKKDPGSWVPRNWVLHDVKGDPDESVQIELIGCSPNCWVDLKYITILTEGTLTSELVLFSKEQNTSPIEVQASILSHLTVSTPEATYAVGLEGSDYIEIPEFSSSFCINPDDDDAKTGFGKDSRKIIPKLVSEAEERGDDTTEETENYKQLDQNMSRIYTAAPQYFTIIDRGRRNSVVVGRKGFEEVYTMSPGSKHDWYSKYSYVCIGQSAFLKPISLAPGSVWHGIQHLQNPNL